MAQHQLAEKWKTVQYGFEVTTTGRIEVSNWGRLRTFNQASDGNIISGSLVNGYRIVRVKLYKPRKEHLQKKFDLVQQQVFKLARRVKLYIHHEESKTSIAETTKLYESLKLQLSKDFADDLKARTINYQQLVHRLVAEYFLAKPKANQTIVAHINYDKLNNQATNLTWMTPQENYEHQAKSPYVIEALAKRKTEPKENKKSTKLTVTKVMLLKKLLNQDKPMKRLVKQFKVTDTQILRIKRGENWAEIKAAN